MQELAQSGHTTKYQNREVPGKAGAPLALERVEDYLSNLAAKGRAQGTIDGYRRSIRRLYHALPDDDKVIHSGTLRHWREQLLEGGYSPTAVNHFIAAANGYLDYVHARELQLTDALKAAKTPQPELTRSEYLRLLSTARALGKKRVYLLVKVFGNTDLPVHEVERLTVEAVQAGMLSVGSGSPREIIRFPECICRELLDYAKQEKIQDGPIFRTREGTPMGRSNVTIGIRQLCVAAGVPEEKGSPRCLRKLYQSTRKGIERSISLLIDQAQERLLEEEQLAVGWETP